MFSKQQFNLLFSPAVTDSQNIRDYVSREMEITGSVLARKDRGILPMLREKRCYDVCQLQC